jgi:hypothetical protein
MLLLVICKWSSYEKINTKAAPSIGKSFLQQASVSGSPLERKCKTTKVQSPEVHPHQHSITDSKKAVAAPFP